MQGLDRRQQTWICLCRALKENPDNAVFVGEFISNEWDRPLSYLLHNGYEGSCMIPYFRLLFRVQDQARLMMMMLEVPLEMNGICPRMFWLQQVERKLEEAGVYLILEQLEADSSFMKLSGEEGRFGREEVRSVTWCIRGDNWFSTEDAVFERPNIRLASFVGVAEGDGDGEIELNVIEKSRSDDLGVDGGGARGSPCILGDFGFVCIGVLRLKETVSGQQSLRKLFVA